MRIAPWRLICLPPSRFSINLVTLALLSFHFYGKINQHSS
jgi:hypothetical protein